MRRGRGVAGASSGTIGAGGGRWHRHGWRRLGRRRRYEWRRCWRWRGRVVGQGRWGGRGRWGSVGVRGRRRGGGEGDGGGVSIGYSCTDPPDGGGGDGDGGVARRRAGAWGHRRIWDRGRRRRMSRCAMAPVVALVVAVRVGDGGGYGEGGGCCHHGGGLGSSGGGEAGQPRCRHIDRTASSRPCSCRH